MTSYHGGKQKIGEKIALLIKKISMEIEKETGTQFKGYAEPFCGMLGVYRHIPDMFQDHVSFKYHAGDINESVIKMWKALQKGWKPPTQCSERKFYQLKGDGKSSAEKGFIGHACGYRSTYFSTFFDRVDLKKVADKTLKIVEKIKGINFQIGSYHQFSKLRGYIIYCDPPYFKGSKYMDEYGKIRNFDYDDFYEWLNRMSRHNLIFLSERAKLPFYLLAKFEANEKFYLVNRI